LGMMAGIHLSFFCGMHTPLLVQVKTFNECTMNYRECCTKNCYRNKSLSLSLFHSLSHKS
jgi:hypothetical protein